MSVVTISAPHYGTCLAQSPLARFGQNPIRNLGQLPALLGTAFALLQLLPREWSAISGLSLGSPRDALTFVEHVITDRRMIADLCPAAITDLRTCHPPDPEVKAALTCFVTAAPVRNGGTQHDRPLKRERSDPFYQRMFEMARDSCTGETPKQVEDTVQVLRDVISENPGKVIRSKSSATLPELLHALDTGLNDGAVNSSRQLLNPWIASEVGGLVIADHLDVVGHYNRIDEAAGGREINAGLFYSGAGFGDDEFFALYERVAEVITIRGINERDA